LRQRISAKPGGSMLTRGLTLLAAYRPGETELSQKELARRTGLPKPTVHRLVIELVEWTALERTRTGVRLGQWLFVLGESVPRIGMLRTVGQPYLDRLHDLTREHTCLSVLCGDTAMDVAWAGPVGCIRAGQHARPGTVSPAATKALLASPSRGTADAAQGPYVVRRTVGAPGEADGVRRDAPGADGVPTQRGGRVHRENRLVSTALPVSVFGGAVAAVSVVGQADSVDVRGVTSPLRSIAVAFSRRLALTALFGPQPD
jgi:DNA-binding IclR family transcriptional regulator